MRGVRTQEIASPMANTDDNMMELMAPLMLEFGKSVYICQCFEESLCFLLSLMSHEEAKGEEGAFRAAWDFNSKKTLGNLVKALRERIDIPPDLEQYLDVGVDARNKIVHGFMTKNWERWTTPKGRLELEQELVTLKLEVKRRDVAGNKLLDALLKKYGLSNDHLKERAGKMWKHLNPKTDPPSPSSTH